MDNDKKKEYFLSNKVEKNRKCPALAFGGLCGPAVWWCQKVSRQGQINPLTPNRYNCAYGAELGTFGIF